MVLRFIITYCFIVKNNSTQFHCFHSAGQRSMSTLLSTEITSCYEVIIMFRDENGIVFIQFHIFYIYYVPLFVARVL